MIKLSNTLTKRIEEIKPLSAPKVTVYTCGPTVYDYPHIGNWFTFIRYDLLVRTLKLSGLKPKWVMNITDVGHLVSDADEGEDKLEKGAKREGKTAWDIADFYTKDFLAGLKKLNFLEPDKLPRATQLIKEQVALVKRLEAKGFTYQIDDGIYFDTSKFDGYGKLGNIDLAGLQTGARVHKNKQKRHPTDFALWKFSPKDGKRDMEWDSPWGKGFPGWHLECSVMSMKYLGDTIDVHAGGIDHIPTHHNNEIAQSQSVTGKPLAKYWLHANHILINDAKIAKSSGNGITLQEIEKKRLDTLSLRALVLESHYKTQASFSWTNLRAAQNRLNAYKAMADLRFQPRASSGQQNLLFKEATQSILAAMQDDLDTPEALKQLSALEVTLSETMVSKESVGAFNEFLVFIDDLLGLGLSECKDIDTSQRGLLKLREQARTKQDWNKTDKLRNKLADEGIAVRDTVHGQVWSRY